MADPNKPDTAESIEDTYGGPKLRQQSAFGSYEILDTLGRGGMGTVLKGRHISLGRIVAIKVLNASSFPVDAVTAKRFALEARAGSKLSHPNLVAVFDFGATPAGEPYLVMEHVDGESLDLRIARLGKLEAEDVRSIANQVCKALQYIHANGIVHRDLKSSNIMLHRAGDDEFVKVLDFGIAKIVSDSGNTFAHLTATGAVFGSPAYMSPEQCMGTTTDARSDLYSLGCVLYECLSGAPPFRGENPLQTIFKHVNEETAELSFADPVANDLALIAQKCLKKNPDERYSSAQELLSVLPLAGTGKLRRSSENARLGSRSGRMERESSPGSFGKTTFDFMGKDAGKVLAIGLFIGVVIFVVRSSTYTVRDPATGKPLVTVPVNPFFQLSPQDRAFMEANNKGIAERQEKTQAAIRKQLEILQRQH